MLLTFLSVKFLSTLSLRRATHVCCALAFFFLYFYPRSPCGERQTSLMLPCRALIFLSTLSLRRATLRAMAAAQDNAISIHALLAESDISSSGVSAGRMHFYPRSPCGERRHYLAQPQARHNFYPRSPCGERPSSVLMALPSYIFLSTLSLRRATVDFSSNARATLISIHALLAESDMPISTSFPIALNFYPHSPCGERRYIRGNIPNFTCISIHALLAESDSTAFA